MMQGLTARILGRVSQTLAAACFPILAASASAQTLNLQFSNSSVQYLDSEIFFTFTLGQQGYEFTGSYGSTVLSNVGTPQGMYWSNSYQYWNPSSTSFQNSTANLWFSDPISLQDLNAAGGLKVTKGDSVRAYVSLGSPLNVIPTTSGTDTLINSSMATFGAPSVTSTVDPNYNIRWDIFEFTVTPSLGDQGDLTSINATAINMRVESWVAGGTAPAQQVQTSNNFNDLMIAAQSYYNSNTANNTNPQVQPINPMVMNNGTFLRALGITNGQQAGYVPTPSGSGFIYTPAPGAGAVATIGANATFGDYVAYVHDNSIVTPLTNPAVQPYSGTYSYAFSGSTYTQAWTASQVVSASWQIYGTAGTFWSEGTLTPQITGGTGAAIVLEGEFIQTVAAAGGSFTTTGTLGKYKMILPPDYISTTTFSNYLQSSVLYSGAQAANYGYIFEYTPYEFSSSTYLSTSTYLNYNDFVAAAEHFADSQPDGSELNADTVMSKAVHDLAAGYNFGLIGSTVVDPATGLTFNDEGSEIWTMVWAKLQAGGATVTTYNGTTYMSSTLGAMPLYSALQPDSPFYNQWAEMIYESSQTAYGGTYSDYLQPVDVNLLGSPNQVSYNIDHVTLTILDTTVVPEASAVSLLVLAGAGFWFSKARAKRRRAES